MKAGWCMKRLGDVCDIVGGGTPSKSVANYYSGNILWATVRDMRSDWLKETECKINRIAIKESATTLIPKGNVIIATRVGLGKVCLLENDTAINQDLKGVLPKNANVVDKLFLFHWLKSVSDVIIGHGTGATVQGVKIPFIAGLNIPIPPLPEQKRIAVVLEETFDAIAKTKENAEKNLANARELFESYLQSELLNDKWEQKLLGEVCEGIEYGTSSKSKKSGKVPVLRMGNIQNGRIDWTKLVYSDDKTEIKKYLLKHNDVLFNRTNSPEWVGKTAIYKSERPAIFAGYLIRIHRKEKLLDADYLNYFLNSDMAMKYGKTVTISSVNQANINGAKLMRYPIPVPPIAEQKNIVKRLNSLATEIQRLDSVYTRKISDLEELKKSILLKAFSGELVGAKS